MPATIMSSKSPLVLLFTLLTLFVNTLNVGAQRFTTTLPWVDGDTIIVSQSTNALGVTLAIETLSTILPLTTTGAVRPTTTSTGLLTTTTTPLVPTTTSIPLVATTPLVPTTTTTPLVPTTTSTPVRVTTDPLEVETTTSRRRSSTSIAIVATPTVAPGEVVPVSAGTIMDYSDYQQSINQAAQTGDVNPALNGGSNSNGASKVDVGLGMGMGLTVLGGVVVGVVGLF